MTKGITSPEPDPRVVYADIIDLPPWRSPTRPPMPLADRAAQFAPFAALTGFEDMITEESREVDRKIEPGPEELDRLNTRLLEIAEELSAHRHPEVTVTYFVPDPKKAGGRYETLRAAVRRLNPALHELELQGPDRRLILSFSDLLSLE